MQTRYLTVLDVIALNDEILRRSGETPLPVRDEGGLESALMRPQMAAHYENADLITQAAVLIAGVALAHAFVDGSKRTALAFVDGNKRTALAVGTIFLALNGLQIVSEPGALGRQIEAIVNRAGRLDEATTQFSEWMRPRMRQMQE
ncbi:MAG: type II toxin-antitoxin system death-on-curing family toxin [Ktedonobacterales bacterium]